MQVKKVFETEDGTLEFEGTLQGDELAYTVEVGLNVLLANGAIKVAEGLSSDGETIN